MSAGNVWPWRWGAKSGITKNAAVKPLVVDVAALNLLTEDVAVELRYVPKLEHRRIDFYYTGKDRVMIAGVSDNNYIYWLSETELSDKKTNQVIFDHIARVEPTRHGDMATVARKLGYGHQELRGFYRNWLSYVGGECPAPDDVVWRTPFGVSYIKSEEENNGRFFATGIRAFLHKLKMRCRFREAGGKYLEIMRDYLAVLEHGDGDPVKHYEDMHELIDLLHEERYLLCSDDERVRALYLQLDECCSSLYNAYMSIVR